MTMVRCSTPSRLLATTGITCRLSGIDIRTANDPSLHNARYDFNDEILPLGAALFVRLAERALAPAQP